MTDQARHEYARVILQFYRAANKPRIEVALTNFDRWLKALNGIVGDIRFDRGLLSVYFVEWQMENIRSASHMRLRCIAENYSLFFLRWILRIKLRAIDEASQVTKWKSHKIDCWLTKDPTKRKAWKLIQTLFETSWQFSTDKTDDNEPTANGIVEKFGI